MKSNLLLDTHIVYWLLNEPRKLDKKLVDHITNNDHLVLVSHVSLWEMAIKKSIGKMDFPLSLRETVKKAGFNMLPISLEHILKTEDLPFHHRDPFDRILIAQALCEDLMFVTFDNKIQSYDVKIWGK